MFETTTPQSKRTPFWWIIPVAVLLCAAIVLAFAYLGSADQSEKGPLTGVLHPGDPDYQWYSKHVGLESRGIKLGKNFAGKRMVIFSGVIHNEGERTLDVVQVKLTLFNQNEAVFEAVKDAVRPGAYSPPVPSLEDRAFTIYLENLPGNWQASRAEMEIHGFRFAKE